ncbi:peptidylprolyl isomerase [Paenibacillus sp. 1001270B_150601_E10]|uniref:peptidylprolyl isomerase n=1 Tax=Paenibacillus sp. 1001270B_150601_E10 TaxID=2787079 RepID=UPI00189CBCF8|nr:peptidylprolyl isomerase [Paenibacillus sp. 1001270B_150601_E10]
MLQSKKGSWKVSLVALMLVLALSVVAACGNKNGSEPADNSPVVATYKGGTVTQNQFDKELANMLFFYPSYQQMIEMDEFRQYFIKQQIAYLYLEDKATDAAKKEGKKEAEEQMAAIKKQVGDDEFKKMLDAQKLTEQDVMNYMTRIMTVVADYNAKVTDEQLKAQFEKDKQNMTTASVRHILIGFTDAEGKERKKEDALKLAKDLQARLKKGEDFAKLAKEFSEDPASKENGGLYEDVAVGQWVEQFRDAALTLPLNEISDPVETSYGYHVMKVEKRTEKVFDKLTDEEKDQIRGTIASEEMNKFMEDELEKIVKDEDIKLPAVKTEEEKKDDSTSTEGDKSTETDKSADTEKSGDANKQDTTDKQTEEKPADNK